jgi:hypothetical protein
MTRLHLINELLRYEDIEGLLSMGAPDDEYESEAEKIADRVGEAEKKTNDEITREEVENIVATVWKEMFGCPMSTHDEERMPLPRSLPGSSPDSPGCDVRKPPHRGLPRLLRSPKIILRLHIHP